MFLWPRLRAASIGKRFSFTSDSIFKYCVEQCIKQNVRDWNKYRVLETNVEHLTKNIFFEHISYAVSGTLRGIEESVAALWLICIYLVSANYPE